MSTSRLLHKKEYPYTVPGTVLLYCTTVLQYFKLLLHCSVPGTDSCIAITTAVLYCCTTAVLFCIVVYHCAELY